MNTQKNTPSLTIHKTKNIDIQNENYMYNALLDRVNLKNERYLLHLIATTNLQNLKFIVAFRLCLHFHGELIQITM